LIFSSLFSVSLSDIKSVAKVYHKNLEKLVEERTAKLQQAYRTLKKAGDYSPVTSKMYRPELTLTSNPAGLGLISFTPSIPA
jgi:hypothetical protein